MGKRADLRLRRQRKHRNNTIAIVAIGILLLALTWIVLSNGRSSTNERTDESSVIPVQVNYPSPELSLQNINGQTESLADYRDKILLVNNWATWCPPCKAEMPTLVDFYKAHANEGLMIVAIEAGEPKEQVQQFADSLQIPFAVWLDPNGLSMKAFRNSNLPNSYVIDQSGTIRYAWVGQISRAMLEKYVTPLLHEN